MDPNTIPPKDPFTVPYNEFVQTLKKAGEAILTSLTPEKCDLLHMAVGVAGEGGELLDAVKRHIIYDQPLDTIIDEATGQTIREGMVEELGDLLFYIEGVKLNLGISEEEILMKNREKLSKRYKKLTYSDTDAKNRADKK